MSEPDSGSWKGATEIPMPCSACNTFTKVAVDRLMSDGGFTCSTCNLPVALGLAERFQLEGMKTLMSARR